MKEVIVNSPNATITIAIELTDGIRSAREITNSILNDMNIIQRDLELSDIVNLITIEGDIDSDQIITYLRDSNNLNREIDIKGDPITIPEDGLDAIDIAYQDIWDKVSKIMSIINLDACVIDDVRYQDQQLIITLLVVDVEDGDEDQN